MQPPFSLMLSGLERGLHRLEVCPQGDTPDHELNVHRFQCIDQVFGRHQEVQRSCLIACHNKVQLKEKMLAQEVPIYCVKSVVRVNSIRRERESCYL
jgi:hypothetical protein